MIELDESLRVGSGNGRTTYRHPNDASRLLKIEHAPVKGRLRWYERPPNIAPSNVREFDGYTHMIKRLGTSLDFVSDVHGWEETNKGIALVVENAAHGLRQANALNGILRGKASAAYTRDDLLWARMRYSEIADIFCARGIYNHGLKPESVLLGWKGDELKMKLFDFKTIVYRQLISPRYIPWGQHNVQMHTIRSVQRKFDTLLDNMKSTDRSSN